MKYEEYRERVIECRKSGKGEEIWCREQGIKRETYHSWKMRVRKKEGLNGIDLSIGRKIPSKPRGYKEYRKFVVECRTSGKPAEQWCAEHGLLFTTYCTWRKKVYRKEGKEAINQECGIREVSNPRTGLRVQSEPELVEIRLWREDTVC